MGSMQDEMLVPQELEGLGWVGEVCMIFTVLENSVLAGVYPGATCM